MATANSSTDPILERMLAILERLGNPTVNVNIQMPDGKRKKNPVLSSPATQQPDMEPGGYPRPYTS